jgi:SAM-dependent methyltransferase
MKEARSICCGPFLVNVVTSSPEGITGPDDNWQLALVRLRRNSIGKLAGMAYDKTDISKTYNHGRDLAPDVLKQWMDVVVGHLDEGTIRCIVDLGCGTGRFLPSLSERFAASVIGVDPSSKMLAGARIDRSPAGVLYVCRNKSSSQRDGNWSNHRTNQLLSIREIEKPGGITAGLLNPNSDSVGSCTNW